MQISALVPEIFKFEKWVKYTNEMTDDVIHSTQIYVEYVNRAILANLQCKTLKLGRLHVIVLQETHLHCMTIKNSIPMATHSFPVPTHLIQIVKLILWSTFSRTILQRVKHV